MQNGLLAKKFVPYRTTGYDTRKGSFARTFVRDLPFAKRRIHCRKEIGHACFFVNKYVKID